MSFSVVAPNMALVAARVGNAVFLSCEADQINEVINNHKKRGEKGDNFLMLGIQSRCFDVVRVLLRAESAVFWARENDHEGRNIYHYLAMYASREMLRFCLLEDAVAAQYFQEHLQDIDGGLLGHRDNAGETAMECIKSMQDVDCKELLLYFINICKVVDFSKCLPVCETYEQRFMATMKILKRLMRDPELFRGSALLETAIAEIIYHAAEYGSCETLFLLCELGIDVLKTVSSLPVRSKADAPAAVQNIVNRVLCGPEEYCVWIQYLRYQKGHWWEAEMNKQLDTLESHLKPGLYSHCEYWTEGPLAAYIRCKRREVDYHEAARSNLWDFFAKSSYSYGGLRWGPPRLPQWLLEGHLPQEEGNLYSQYIFQRHAHLQGVRVEERTTTLKWLLNIGAPLPPIELFFKWHQFHLLKALCEDDWGVVSLTAPVRCSPPMLAFAETLPRQDDLGDRSVGQLLCAAAAYYDEPDILVWLCGWLTDVNMAPLFFETDGMTLLHIAASHDSFLSLKMLLRLPFDLTQFSHSGHTAAHLAAMNNCRYTTFELLKHCDWELQDSFGQTLVDVIGNCTDEELVKFYQMQVRRKRYLALYQQLSDDARYSREACWTEASALIDFADLINEMLLNCYFSFDYVPEGIEAEDDEMVYIVHYFHHN